jgi:CRP/FNR family transcriptional regulator, cyclic AMP receptor protein
MERVNVLKQTDIFYDLTSAQLEMIASICQERTVRAGEVLFQENTPGTEMYAIVRGEIEILLDPSLVGGATTRKGSGPVTVASLREGQTFGEMALVDQGLRSASARGAADNTKLLIIPRQKLLTLCETYPELGYRIMRNMAADMAFKIRNSDLTIREQLLWRPRQAI